MISYSLEQIKERLLQFCTLMEFRYHGLECNIDPFNPNHFHLACNGEEADAHSIEEVIAAPFFDGKCLAEIAGEIEITGW